jgi:hypothetical protein
VKLLLFVGYLAVGIVVVGLWLVYLDAKEDSMPGLMGIAVLLWPIIIGLAALMGALAAWGWVAKQLGYGKCV